MGLLDDQNQKKTPGQTIADAAVAGYDKGASKKSSKKQAIPSLKKGGMVKKTGLHILHKGEKVIPASKVKLRKNPMRKRTSVNS